ncbi:asparaginase [Streptosporangium soli]|nr:asparaginase [Streptosporangium sp. KLBMP 9127]
MEKTFDRMWRRRTGAALVLALTAATWSAGTPQAVAEKGAAKPKVVVIGTGGTIAGEAESRVGFESYKPGRLPVADLVKSLQPEVGGLAEVSTAEFGGKGSSEYTIAEFHDLSRLVDEKLKTADAVVVATGTQTMEELAYWLDLTVRSPKPVVLTGSMRPWNVIGGDGPANLYKAVSLAASKRTHCFGSVVLFNDEIFAAREVTKSSTLRLDTFQAPEVGQLGSVDEKRIQLLRAPARVQRCGKPESWRTPFDLAGIKRDALPRAEIVYTYGNAGGEAVTAFAEAGAKGLVFAGTPSPGQFEAAQGAVKKGVKLVAANRNNAGAVHAAVPGVISAGDLSPQKARLLLLLSLASTDDPKKIQSWFTGYGTPQF